MNFNKFSRRSILLLILFFIVPGLSAQWEWQNPLQQGNYLNDVHVFSPDTFWIVGNKGTVMNTTNGGNEWEIKQISIGWDLNNLFMFSSQHAFIAADYGRIFKTSDGGENWEECVTPDDDDLFDLHFINQDTGWACGYYGTIFKTTDEGNNWIEINTPYTQSFNSIFFQDKNNGWLACGEKDCSSHSGLILKTTNGGYDWDTSYYYHDYYFDDIMFIDSVNGLALGFNLMWQGIILQTFDGGNTWETTFEESITVLSDAWYYSKDTIFVVACLDMQDPYFKIIKTHDGGQNWEIQEHSIRSTPTGISGSSFNNIVSIGRNGQILTSSDGGNVWDLISSGYYDNINDIEMLDENNGWCVGEDGRILHTTDGGNHWIEQQFINGANLTTASFYDDQLGIVAGGYNIYKTSDGGNTWMLVKDDCLEPINAVFFASQYTGWAVGRNGYILKTQNSGSDWTQINTGYENWLEDVFFVNTAVGWIVGRDGLILKTTTSGDTWFRQADSLSGGSLYFSVHFINTFEGWVAGWYNVILHTSDGGENWEIQNIYDDQNSLYTYGLKDIIFADSEHGWAAGYGIGPHPIVMGTTDGGETWEDLDCPTKGLLYAVQFTDPNNGWVVGTNGTILHTNSGGGVEIDFHDTSESNHSLFTYPNPFSTSNTFKYELSGSSHVQLIIYNVEGKIIEVAINQEIPQGTHTYTWNAEGLPSGLYYAVITSNDGTAVAKMIKR